MGFKVADRVKEIINAPGTGNVTLSNNPAIGFQSFSNCLSDGDYTYYVLEQRELWETGYGQYLNGQLSRDFIFDSYNSGQIVNFDGFGAVSITYPSERAVYTTQDNHYTVAGSGLIFDNEPSKVIETDTVDLYWDEKKLAYNADLVYVSGLAVDAEETLEINYISGVANYASGQSIINNENIIYVSGLAAGNKIYDNVSSDTSLENNLQVLFVDSESSEINVYMPLASGNGGKEFTIKHSAGINGVNIIASGTETIDGQPSFTMHYPYQSTTLISNNLNWFIT